MLISWYRKFKFFSCDTDSECCFSLSSSPVFLLLLDSNCLEHSFRLRSCPCQPRTCLVCCFKFRNIPHVQPVFICKNTTITSLTAINCLRRFRHPIAGSKIANLQFIKRLIKPIRQILIPPSFPAIRYTPVCWQRGAKFGFLQNRPCSTQLLSSFHKFMTLENKNQCDVIYLDFKKALILYSIMSYSSNFGVLASQDLFGFGLRTI